MVFGRKGIGGPQLAEVNRMLAAERGQVAADFEWLKACTGRLAHAEAALEDDFTALAR